MHSTHCGSIKVTLLGGERRCLDKKGEGTEQCSSGALLIRLSQSQCNCASDPGDGAEALRTQRCSALLCMTLCVCVCVCVCVSNDKAAVLHSHDFRMIVNWICGSRRGIAVILFKSDFQVAKVTARWCVWVIVMAAQQRLNRRNGKMDVGLVPCQIQCCPHGETSRVLLVH